MKEKTHKILIEITTKELKYFMDKLNDTIFSFRLKKAKSLNGDNCMMNQDPNLSRLLWGKKNEYIRTIKRP